MVVVGVSYSFGSRPEVGPSLVALGLQTKPDGAAGFLRMRCSGRVASRILGYLVALTFFTFGAMCSNYGWRIYQVSYQRSRRSSLCAW